MPPPSRFRGQLNPAFGAAHGLPDDDAPRAAAGGRSSARRATAPPSRDARVRAALRAARATGRLQLADCHLTALPDGAVSFVLVRVSALRSRHTLSSKPNLLLSRLVSGYSSTCAPASKSI